MAGVPAPPQAACSRPPAGPRRDSRRARRQPIQPVRTTPSCSVQAETGNWKQGETSVLERGALLRRWNGAFAAVALTIGVYLVPASHAAYPPLSAGDTHFVVIAHRGFSSVA